MCSSDLVDVGAGFLAREIDAAPPQYLFGAHNGPCIPGATITGKRDDGGYDALVTMKMGPMSLSYKGQIEIVEQDDATRTAVMRAKATEAKGQGTAQATLTMKIDDADGGQSHVHVGSDILVTGRVAQMGRGIMTDVAEIGRAHV